MIFDTQDLIDELTRRGDKRCMESSNPREQCMEVFSNVSDLCESCLFNTTAQVIIKQKEIIASQLLVKKNKTNE